MRGGDEDGRVQACMQEAHARAFIVTTRELHAASEGARGGEGGRERALLVRRSSKGAGESRVWRRLRDDCDNCSTLDSRLPADSSWQSRRLMTPRRLSLSYR